jgi:hypothetical protein
MSSKCHMRLYRARVREHLLVWYCDVPGHDHGRHHPRMKRLTEESIAIPADEFYEGMLRSDR